MCVTEGTTGEDERRGLEDLRLSFPIEDLGGVSYYLACHSTRNRKARTVTFDPRQYVQTVADHFDITKTSIIHLSLRTAPFSKADELETDADMFEMRNISHREAVRGVILIATLTGPD